MDRFRKYWSALHRDAADDLAAVCHPNKPLAYNRFVDRIFRKAWVRALRGLPLGRAIEVGCGRGRWIADLRARGAVAWGLDIAPAARPSAVARAEALPLRAATADFIYAITVLQHLENKPRALDEMVRALRPGGHLMVLELIDYPGISWQEHVMPESAEWWRDELARRGFSLLRDDAVEYLPLVRWIERHAPKHRAAGENSAPPSPWKARARRAAWFPITWASVILEPLSPLLGVSPTHRIFLARKN